MAAQVDGEEEDVEEEVNDESSEKSSDNDDDYPEECFILRTEEVGTEYIPEGTDDNTDKKLPPNKRKHSSLYESQDNADFSLSNPRFSHSSISTNLHVGTTSAQPAPTNTSNGIILNLHSVLLDKLVCIEDLEAKVVQLKKTIVQLKHEKKVLRSNIALYEPSIGNQSEEPVSYPTKPTKQISAKDCIDATRQYIRTLRSYKADDRNPSFLDNTCSQIISIIWDDDLFCGRIVTTLVFCAKTWLSNNNFSPHKVLRAMDLRGGGLNYKGIEILRRCETGGRKYVRNTVLPSTPALQRAANIVQSYGQQCFPYHHGKVEGIGEFIRFNPLHAIEAAVRLSGLQESAKRRRIQLAESVDGAKISKNLNFVMLGVKNQDSFATDPDLGELTFAKKV